MYWLLLMRFSFYPFKPSVSKQFQMLQLLVKDLCFPCSAALCHLVHHRRMSVLSAVGYFYCPSCQATQAFPLVNAKTNVGPLSTITLLEFTSNINTGIYFKHRIWEPICFISTSQFKQVLWLIFGYYWYSI